MIERWSTNGTLKSPHATSLHAEPANEAMAGTSGSTTATTARGTDAAATDGVAAGGDLASGGITEAVSPKKAKPPRGRWGARIGWTAAMVSVGVLVGLIVIWGLKFIDGPVTSTKSTTLAQLQATPLAAPEMNLWSGKHVQMKYPGIFDQIGLGSGSASTIEAYNLSSKRGYDRQVSINVSNFATPNMTEDSSYAFRKLHPSDYTEKKLTLGGEPAYEMMKSDKTELTLFWPHKAKLLTISMTSTNPAKDNLSVLMGQIEPTIEWRQ